MTVVDEVMVGPMIAASIRRMAIGFAEAHRSRMASAAARESPRFNHRAFVMEVLSHTSPCSIFESEKIPLDRMTEIRARCLTTGNVRSMLVTDLALRYGPPDTINHLAVRLACPVCEVKP